MKGQVGGGNSGQIPAKFSAGRVAQNTQKPESSNTKKPKRKQTENMSRKSMHEVPKKKVCICRENVCIEKKNIPC